MTWWRHEMNSHLRLLNDPSPESSVHTYRVKRTQNERSQTRTLVCLYHFVVLGSSHPPVGSLARSWGGWYYVWWYGRGYWYRSFYAAMLMRCHEIHHLHLFLERKECEKMMQWKNVIYLACGCILLLSCGDCGCGFGGTNAYCTKHQVKFIRCDL